MHTNLGVLSYGSPGLVESIPVCIDAMKLFWQLLLAHVVFFLSFATQLYIPKHDTYAEKILHKPNHMLRNKGAY